ncbi:hypothetical protein LMG9964_01272 [Paraburkholderia phenoliruptrix]|uniref:Uncharacterized protein n=1 Tax=Paraburkholderia phenoliruptrix TaxID=252970 RepID=A0A6J5K0M0_9BURK|nr:hypothetical protein LMG9964_01272 [Paraburkholderia phenoliruptrix]
MSKLSKPKRINKRDYCRVLATETLPYETPIIFSNEGLYNNVSRLRQATGVKKVILDGVITGEAAPKFSPTNPHSFKIRKNSLEFRRLALIHPTSQWRIKKFLRKIRKSDTSFLRAEFGVYPGSKACCCNILYEDVLGKYK